MAPMARHPFDMRSSGRDPFPCFAAAMQHVAVSDQSDGDSTHSSDTGSETESENAQFRPRNGSSGSNDQERLWCKQENDDDCDGGCDSPSECDCADPEALRWSIDALATLLPVAISPLPQQRQQQHNHHSDRRRRRWTTAATATESDDRFTRFFEDEEQFCVLRTPVAIIERERQSQMQQSSVTASVSANGGGGGAAEYARWRTPEGIRWRDLHRRCVETMELCDERLRERQHKLRKLSIPASKLKLKRRSTSAQSNINQRSSSSAGRTRSTATTTTTSTATCPWASPTAPTPVRRSGPPPREREPLTPVGFGAIGLSPIPKDTTTQTKQPTAIHSDSFSPSCSTTSTTSSRTSAVSLNVSGFASPALSSIAEHASDVLTPSFASLRFPNSDCEQGDDHEQKENKENTTPPPSRSSHSEYNSSKSSSSGEGSSLRTISLLRHSGGDGGGGGGEGSGGVGDSLLWSVSSSSPSSMLSSSLSSSPFTPPPSFPHGDTSTTPAATVLTSTHQDQDSSTTPAATVTNTHQDQDSEAIAIARRQRSFLAAIEEEAQLRDAEIKQQQTQSEQLQMPVRETPLTQPHSRGVTEESEPDVATDDDGAAAPRRRIPLLHGGSPIALSHSQLELRGSEPQSQIASPPATSMAAIYKEARALGITEPTAQWEYVQLISRQTAAVASSSSFQRRLH